MRFSIEELIPEFDFVQVTFRILWAFDLVTGAYMVLF